jgi:hypothetical protein
LGVPGKLGGHPPGYRKFPMQEADFSDEELDKMAEDMFDWVERKKSECMPIILSGFAVEQKMSRQQLQKACDRNEKLNKAKAYAKAAQNEQFLQGGLLKDSGYNASFIQFLLTHTDNYVPKQSKKDKAAEAAGSQLAALNAGMKSAQGKE